MDEDEVLNRYPIDEFRSQETNAIKDRLFQIAEEAYQQRECEYPVIAGFTRYQTRVSEREYQLDGAALQNHFAIRFDDPGVSEILNADGKSAFELMLKFSKESLRKAALIEKTARERVDAFYTSAPATTPLGKIDSIQEKVNEFAEWLTMKLNWLGRPQDLLTQNKADLEKTVQQVIEDRYFPEIRRMERTVLLRILDDSWMGHLLAMDHLRSAVSFRGMGQMDPKVEYKREGMRLFDQMWFAIGERMTDIIFRMEGLDEELVTSSFVETTARHDSAPTQAELAADDAQQQRMAAADAASSEAPKSDPIRRDFHESAATIHALAVPQEI